MENKLYQVIINVSDIRKLPQESYLSISKKLISTSILSVVDFLKLDGYKHEVTYYKEESNNNEYILIGANDDNSYTVTINIRNISN